MMSKSPASEHAKVRCAYGEVVNVRPVHSREVTRVEVELPIEAHVALTQMAYGKSSLVLPMVLPGSVAYGLVDVPMGSLGETSRQPGADPFGEGGDEIHRACQPGASSQSRPAPAPGRSMRCAYGQVVNVRPIHSREVTRAEIELPIESHIILTQLLYGKQVVMIAVNLPGAQKYGVTEWGAGGDAAPDQGAAGAGEPAAATPATSGTSGQRSGSAFGLGRRRQGTGPVGVDVIRWLGARCKEAAFQEWLQVRTEAAAIERVRALCGVSSRSEIPTSDAAMLRFRRDIFEPYLRQQAGRAAVA